jgi:hypothetical protein
MYEIDGGDATAFKGGGGMGGKERDDSRVGGTAEELKH